jgi:DNA-binding XRE family transcriptional regulator
MNNYFFSRCQEFRNKAKLSQVKLVEKADVNRKIVRRIEKGQSVRDTSAFAVYDTLYKMGIDKLKSQEQEIFIILRPENPYYYDYILKSSHILVAKPVSS